MSGTFDTFLQLFMEDAPVMPVYKAFQGAKQLCIGEKAGNIPYLYIVFGDGCYWLIGSPMAGRDDHLPKLKVRDRDGVIVRFRDGPGEMNALWQIYENGMSRTSPYAKWYFIPNAESSSDQVISPGGGTATLEGITTVFFPSGSFGEDTGVSIKTSSETIIEDQFSEFTVMFRPAKRLSYEVQVILDNPPLVETVQVLFNIPSDFAAAVPPGYRIEPFVLIDSGGAPAEHESFPIFVLLEPSSYNPNEGVISFDLPGNAFAESSNGMFIAVITLAPTPGMGGNISRRLQNNADESQPDLQLQNVTMIATRSSSGDCKAASIRCPLVGGCTVTSPFSAARKHPTQGVTKPHWGVDYRAPVGAEVKAAAAGTIERSYMSTSYGNTVIVRHTDGSATLYAHLDSRNVAVGDSVMTGQQLGISGNTGRSSGPHLHLEYVPSGQIIQNKSRIDPDACVGDVTSGSITAGDNGNLADDAFQLSLNGIDIGTTTIGGTNNLSVNNLIPGEYTLVLTVVIAPDNVGTWFIRLNDGLTFADGRTVRIGSDPQGASIPFSVIVPPSSP